jgi:hypothetical protein
MEKLFLTVACGDYDRTRALRMEVFSQKEFG